MLNINKMEGKSLLKNSQQPQRRKYLIMNMIQDW